MRSPEYRFDISLPDKEGHMRVLANPFTDKFLSEEIDYYDLSRAYSKNGVEVSLIRPEGVLNDYLNNNYRIPGIKVPALRVDGNLWMSLTYMEIQSMYVPVGLCRGTVGTAGLGLGYFALRAASLGRVDHVVVFEREPRVVDFFLSRFADRPEMEKIEIIVGDARRDMLWKPDKRTFDLIFMDIYQTMLGDDVVDDALLFREKGSYEEYRFWGQERVLLDAILARQRHPEPSLLEQAFFGAWQNTRIAIDPSNPTDKISLAQLYDPHTDGRFRRKVFDALRIEE